MIWPRKIGLRSLIVNRPEASDFDFTTEMPSLAVISTSAIGSCLRGSLFRVMTAPCMAVSLLLRCRTQKKEAIAMEIRTIKNDFFATLIAILNIMQCLYAMVQSLLPRTSD